jgi:hypothetical protein
MVVREWTLLHAAERQAVGLTDPPSRCGWTRVLRLDLPGRLVVPARAAQPRLGSVVTVVHLAAEKLVARSSACRSPSSRPAGAGRVRHEDDVPAGEAGAAGDAPVLGALAGHAMSATSLQRAVSAGSVRPARRRADVPPARGRRRIGMGRWMERTSPAAAAVFDVAAEVAGPRRPGAGFTGPARELTLTRNAQVAVSPRTPPRRGAGRRGLRGAAGDGPQRRRAQRAGRGRRPAARRRPAAGRRPRRDHGPDRGPGHEGPRSFGLGQDAVREAVCAAGVPARAATRPGREARSCSRRCSTGPAERRRLRRRPRPSTMHGAGRRGRLAGDHQARRQRRVPLAADGGAVAEWSESWRRRRCASRGSRSSSTPPARSRPAWTDVRGALVETRSPAVRWVEDVAGKGRVAASATGLLMEAGDSKVLTDAGPRYRAVTPRTMTMHDPKTLRRLRGETPARQPRPAAGRVW